MGAKPVTLEEILPSGNGGRNSLRALAERVEKATREPPINIWGNVVELTASHIRIAGLSKFIKLGDWVLIETELGGEIAEAIRIDSEFDPGPSLRGCTPGRYRCTCTNYPGAYAMPR